MQQPDRPALPIDALIQLTPRGHRIGYPDAAEFADVLEKARDSRPGADEADAHEYLLMVDAAANIAHAIRSMNYPVGFYCWTGGKLYMVCACLANAAMGVTDWTAADFKRIAANTCENDIGEMFIREDGALCVGVTPYAGKPAPDPRQNAPKVPFIRGSFDA